MICPDCEGTGQTLAFFVIHTDGHEQTMAQLRCLTCQGRGEVDDRYPAWLRRGQEMRRERRERREPLRQAAARLGVSAVEYSKMEFGLIEPMDGE